MKCFFVPDFSNVAQAEAAPNTRSASAEVMPVRLQACSKADPRLRIDETELDMFNNAVWVSNGKVYLLLGPSQPKACFEV